ncbi:type II toxin-antitoxin system death-on-curing family toxin [Streptomyces sp. NPDC090022]|uniref:type II toxin-antitoxin system death-on-curing family toxin n=1 Tax=Streptomyces sp. NPDC090022 TaxID=3365920 RepID=UPI0037FB56BF
MSARDRAARQAPEQVRHLTLAEVTDLAAYACLARDQTVELRAPGLLESAVHRPRARMLGTSAYEDLYEQAAALLHALATNHPLVDGNKRTAWLAAVTFLAVNGADLADADQDVAYDLVIDVASGAEADLPRIAARLRALHATPHAAV